MYELDDISNGICSIKNILYLLIEETQYDLENPDVISVNRILNSYIVEYMRKLILFENKHIY